MLKNMDFFLSKQEFILMKGDPMIVVATLSFMLFPSCNDGPPSNIGMIEGRLSPCPKSPNCVSTQASDQEHRLA
jgi:hypothetical protein